MKLKAKITKNKAIISAIVLMLVAVIAAVTALYAWFINPSRAALHGTKLTVVGDNVTLGSEITLSRTVGGITQSETYTEEDGEYYLFRDGAKQRLALRAVAEGERLSLNIKFKNDAGYDKFSVYFAQVTGDTFTYDGAEYSVLGTVKYYDWSAGDYVWLADYGAEGAQRKERTVVQTGLYAQAEKDENGYAEAQLVFEADFSQLEALGINPEMLWGLSLNIASIGVVGELAAAD